MTTILLMAVAAAFFVLGSLLPADHDIKMPR